jgi:acetyl-CoA C-acetyltransferase
MRTAIIGYAQTKFKEHWDKGLRDLISEAGAKALKNSNIQHEDIDSIICANALASASNGQSQVNALCFDELGIKTSTLISCGDASGAAAIRQAMLEINSGESNVVMVLGVEKITDLLSNQIVSATSQLLDQEFEAYNGATLASIYAMIKRVYMNEFKVTEESIAKIPVHSHSNAVNNELAQFNFKITKEDVLNSQLVADPVRMLNNAAPCDGAAAMVLCKEGIAEKYAEEPLFLISSGIGNDNLALHDREKLTEMRATKIAAEHAYNEARIRPSDINLAEVHDVTSISEVLAVEDLGFCKKGEGVSFIEKSGKSKGPLINLSGGLKACGHPLAATGVRQAIDICNQLKKRGNVKFGLTHTLSGSGSFAVVNIFSR